MRYRSEYTFDDWQTYLANGRKKYERTLYDRGYRIRYTNKFNKQSDIQIVLPWANNHPVITIHSDNTKTLFAPIVLTHWGSSYPLLRSQSVRYTIQKYAGIDVVQRNYSYRIYEKDAKLTPSKIQGCRRCSQTGFIDGYCSPPTCFDGNRDDNSVFSCPIHPEAVERSSYVSWHYAECQHGSAIGHMVKRAQQCYSCNGTKKRDYGNKKVSVPWDGSPIKVQDGNIVKKPLTDLERIVASYAGPTSAI